MTIDDKQSPPKGGNRFAAWIGQSALNISGWKIKGQLPQVPKMLIAIAPHTSNWDFFLGLAVLFVLRIKIRFLGKHTIFIPVIKQLLELIGGIPVKRDASHGVVAQVVDEFNKQSKMILAMSPEGTRSKIFPWKTGFLQIAHQANVPIQLIAFDFAKQAVIIGPLVTTSGDTQADLKRVCEYFSTVTAKFPEKVQTSK